MAGEGETINGKLKDGTPVTIVLEYASIHTGLRRSRLILEAQAAKEPDIDRGLLRFLYADVGAAMSLFRIDGTDLDLPIPFETFLTLSDVTGALCEVLVYKMNPHWVPKSEAERNSPKESSSSAS